MEPSDPWHAAIYGDAFADVYDSWYADVTDAEGTVGFVAALGGPVLELGIGTGRLALAMAAAGLEVHGVDSSSAMVERLRAKPGGEVIEVLVADMSVALPPGPFTTVLVAYNTLFNLAEPGQQAACIALAARSMNPGGHLIIEAAVPGEAINDDRVRVRSIEPDRVVLAVSATDSRQGITVGQFIELAADGVVMRPWRIRLSSIEQLDAMASAAGLDLVSRHGGWRQEPFSQDSDKHVSCYRKVTRGASG